MQNRFFRCDDGRRCDRNDAAGWSAVKKRAPLQINFSLVAGVVACARSFLRTPKLRVYKRQTMPRDGGGALCFACYRRGCRRGRRRRRRRRRHCRDCRRHTRLPPLSAAAAYAYVSPRARLAAADGGKRRLARSSFNEKLE